MTITLYKGVELRSDYSVIFDCDQDFWSEESGFKTPFARYLAEKQSVVRDIENTYFTNDGVLSIDWTVFDGDYEGFTYMSVLLDTGDTKYFFIDSYEYLNEMLRINYSIDVWHTYSAKMKIYNGIIGRANRELDGKRKALPIAYETNKALTFNRTGNFQRVIIIAEYSVFRLLSGDQVVESTQRHNYCSMVCRSDLRTIGGTLTVSSETWNKIELETHYSYTIEEALEIINELTAYQGLAPLGTNKKVADDWFPSSTVANKNYDVKDKIDIWCNAITPSLESLSGSKNENLEAQRYEITQFYLVPFDLFYRGTSSMFNIATGSTVDTSLTIMRKANRGSGNDDADKNGVFINYLFPNLKSENNLVFTERVTLNPTDKTVGIGFKSLFIPYSWNGLESHFDFLFNISPIGFSVALSTEQGLNDISSLFETPLPFTTPSATERQLATLARQQAKAQAVVSTISLAGAALGAVGGLASGGIGIYNAVQAATVGNVVSTTTPIVGGRGGALLASATTQKLNRIPWNQAVPNVVSGAQTIMSGALGFAYSGSNLVSAMNALKSPVNAGEATNSVPDALVNAQFGFGYYTIEPNNEEYVNLLIEKIGYSVFIESNDYRHGQSDFILYGQHEPIQFTTAQVTGPFSNDVRAALEAILLEGAIISYSPYIFDNL